MTRLQYEPVTRSDTWSSSRILTMVKPRRLTSLIVTVIVAIALASASNIAKADDAPAKGKNAPAKAKDQSQPQSPPENGGWRGGHRGRRGFGGRGAMFWKRMNDQEREELRSFVSENFPDHYEEWLSLEGLDDNLCHRYLGRIIPGMLKLKDLSEREPALFKVRAKEVRTEYRLRELVRSYHESTDEKQKQSLEKKIRPLVEKLFDLRQERGDLEIARLENRIGALRAKLDEQQKNRTSEIEADFQRVLSDGDENDSLSGGKGDPDRPGGRRHGAPGNNKRGGRE